MIWARDAKKQHDICIGWTEMVLEVGTSEAEERNPKRRYLNRVRDDIRDNGLEEEEVYMEAFIDTHRSHVKVGLR